MQCWTPRHLTNNCSFAILSLASKSRAYATDVSMGAAGFFPGVGKLRGFETKVPQQGPGVEADEKLRK